MGLGLEMVGVVSLFGDSRKFSMAHYSLYVAEAGHYGYTVPKETRRYSPLCGLYLLASAEGKNRAFHAVCNYFRPFFYN